MYNVPTYPPMCKRIRHVNFKGVKPMNIIIIHILR